MNTAGWRALRRHSIPACVLSGLLCALSCPRHALAEGFSAKINFQRASSASVEGYLPDIGDAFGLRTNGLRYGWNVDNTANAFERQLVADKRLDTGNELQPGGQSRYWQILVPNGIYDVVLAAADSADANGAVTGTRYNINVESARAVLDGVPTGSQWSFGLTRHFQVAVADRLLTVTSGANATNNSLCFIEIQQVAPIYWGAAIIDNARRHKCPVDYVSESDPGVLGYYEGHTKKRVSLLHWGYSWANASLRSQTNYMAKMWARGTIPLFSWSPSGPAGDTNYSLLNFIAGKHDAFLTNWFKVAKAYGKPFFLDFAREMNGTWYTWSEGHPINAGCPPGSFTNMWRHVRNVCTGVGCTNITWVWVVDRDLTNSKHLQPLSGFYPGDDYVDWVGMDLYNSGQTAPYAGEPFKTIYGQTYSNVMHIAPAKPIMICETATKNLRATPKPAWITEALTQLPTAFPNIRAFVWFNWNDGKTNKNWPIEGGDNTLPYATAPVDWASVSAFSNGIASPFYLGSVFTNQANLIASPIMPLVLVSAPTHVAASAANGCVHLRWSAVAGATKYNVYRSSRGKGGPYDLLPRPTSSTNYTDQTAANGTTYHYVITAENMAGESVDSTCVSSTPAELSGSRVASKR